MQVPTKPWYKSWTIIAQLLALLAAFLDGVLQMNVLPGYAVEVIVSVLAVINIALRFKTTQPITFTGKHMKQVPIIALLFMVPFLGACDEAGDRPQNGVVTDTVYDDDYEREKEKIEERDSIKAEH